MVSISSAERPVDSARLAQLEMSIGSTLPESYRAFLSRTNGGEPDVDHFPISGMAGNAFGEIRRFLSLDAASLSDDLDSTRQLLQGKLPATLMAIGYSSTDDMICLSLARRDYGTVYYWDAQSESEEAPWMQSGFANAYFIADDFETFLALLDSFESFDSSAP
jgi:hypothetical protein